MTRKLFTVTAKFEQFIQILVFQQNLEPYVSFAFWLLCLFSQCRVQKVFPSTLDHYGKCSNGTNLENKGLISADRNNKATLLLTIPRSVQVVCKGFIPSNICIAIRWLPRSRFRA